MRQKKESFEVYVKQIDRLILQMAHYVSRKSSIDFDDAYQEMMISVWRSYERFDPNNKASFMTYAYSRMVNRRKTLLGSANAANHVFQREVAAGDAIHDIPEYFSSAARHENAFICSALLDEIERVLKSRRQESTADSRAYAMFKEMRKGASLRQCSQNMQISQGWLSRIMTEKIRPVAAAVV